MNILSGGINPDQDHLIPLIFCFLCILGVENDSPGYCTRACRQALGEHIFFCLRIDHWMHEEPRHLGIHPAQGFLF